MKRRALLQLGLIGACYAGYTTPVPALFPSGSRTRRRIAVLITLAADDGEAQRRLNAFREGLRQTGWVEGDNIERDIRWGASDAERSRQHAAALAADAPDAILATGSAALGPLLNATRTVPIVFVHVPDPVGAGFVDTLARPGGNATGFGQFEFSVSGKWVELLKEIAPTVTRAGVLRDPAFTAAIAQLAAMQTVAPSQRMELVPLTVRAAADIERAVTSFAQTPGVGLILTSSPLVAVHRDLIIDLAARHKLPAVYFERYLAVSGGLISYGPDFMDQFRRSAGYIDRVLRGEKAGDLPVQEPAKYELVLNLKTARKLGLNVPTSLLARANEVIE